MYLWKSRDGKLTSSLDCISTQSDFDKWLGENLKANEIIGLLKKIGMRCDQLKPYKYADL